jgi:hypothetical protein
MEKVKINIISDIAGQYDTLLALIEQMPNHYTLSVGDLIDRGKQSKKVIEYFISREKDETGTVLMGNHECMMLDYLEETMIYGSYGSGHPWLYNGGGSTLEDFNRNVPNNTVDWLKKRPFYKMFGDYFIAHSFIYPEKQLQEVLTRELDNLYCPTNILWNRIEPIRRDFFQIAGHNSNWKLRWFSDASGDFALGIDTSSQKILTGIMIDTDLSPQKENIQIYQQAYL